jgi:hypothetical protein
MVVQHWRLMGGSVISSAISLAHQELGLAKASTFLLAFANDVQNVHGISPCLLAPPSSEASRAAFPKELTLRYQFTRSKDQ